jgi:hypothetical protein
MWGFEGFGPKLGGFSDDKCSDSAALCMHELCRSCGKREFCGSEIRTIGSHLLHGLSGCLCCMQLSAVSFCFRSARLVLCSLHCMLHQGLLYTSCLCNQLNFIKVPLAATDIVWPPAQHKGYGDLCATVSRMYVAGPCSSIAGQP